MGEWHDLCYIPYDNATRGVHCSHRTCLLVHPTEKWSKPLADLVGIMKSTRTPTEILPTKKEMPQNSFQRKHLSESSKLIKAEQH